MEIRNIAVLLDPGNVDRDLVASAVDLARRNEAILTGIAAAEPPLILMGMDGGDAAVALYTEQVTEIEAGLTATRDEFAALIPLGLTHRWVGSVQRPDVALIGLAHTVDLIMIGSPAQGAGRHGKIDVDSVILGAGRPVLLVATRQRELVATKIVVAWKDTKEARRAIVDGLTFLKAAAQVSVVVVDEGDLATERTSMLDAVAWLKSHGVEAQGDVLPNVGGSAEAIIGAATKIGADLIISGAYGHGRLRQWILGGMTRDLLGRTTISRLMSN